MAPSIPTHRPLLTATRAAIAVAVASCASTLYLALATGRVEAAAQAIAPAQSPATCEGRPLAG
jgi:hypothetical protein